MRFLFLLLLIPHLCFAMEAGQDYIVRHATKTDFEIESVGGIQGKKLKYFNGVVAHLTEDQASKLKSKGYTVEKTIRMKTLGSPTIFKIMDDENNKIPWGVKSIQAPEAHKLTQGEGVTVCVVDTGIDSTHPAIGGSVVGGEAIFKYSGSDKSEKPEWTDDHGHGTHVSGTIAAHNDVLLGVAPKAKLYAIKVLDSSGSGTDASVADGIKACIGHGQVINMSIGGGAEKSSILQEALDAAVKANIKIACAAGNDGGVVNSPASQKGCTAISALDQSNKIAYFSSRGPEIAFIAPGVAVKSSVLGGKYDTWSGTSMATPHVAGTMALMLSQHKEILKAKDLKFPATQQGKGEINSLLTVE